MKILFIIFTLQQFPMDRLKIGLKIKKLRELKNLTQEHMTKSIGIFQGAYSRMELGETEITYTKLVKISEELGMRPEEVIVFNESLVLNVMNNQTGNDLSEKIDRWVVE